MENNPKHKKISKFLSLILRHQPQKVGITLDAQGWVLVDELLERLAHHNHTLDRATLETVVETNNKKRFSFSENGLKIRANQGHSITIDLAYEPQTPPEKLYHGTAEKYRQGIQERGLLKKSRHHVHLSREYDTAKQVGSRHGKPLIFEVLTGEMSKDGFTFYQSKNGVWLVESVPYSYLQEIDKSASQHI